jgi:hypothetical protein
MPLSTQVHSEITAVIAAEIAGRDNVALESNDHDLGFTGCGMKEA